MFYVGWDWASEAHDVTVIDDDAGVVDRWALIHDAQGIDNALLARLARLGDPAQMLVAIEARKGLVVDRFDGLRVWCRADSSELVERSQTKVGCESFKVRSG